MKTNKMMRVASILLVVVLLSTCAISATFAKYITTDSAGDSARVAKWGVTLAATGDTAFADGYKDAAGGNIADDTLTATTTTVLTSGAEGDALVAPGTKGDLGSFSIAGDPEVDVKIDYAIEFELGDNWKVAEDAFYCPLVITVNGTAIKQSETINTAEAFEIAVEDAIATELGMTAVADGSGAYTKNVDADKDAETKLDDSVTITWEWAIGASDDATDATNVNDTFLGDAETAATVSFSITGTVTQID